MVILLILTLGMPLTSAIEQDNLIVNGTFDTDTNNWIKETSQNFTILADNGNCIFNTTHTDYLFDANYTDFQNNVTLTNMTYHYGDLYEGGIDEGRLGDGYIELANTTTNLFNLSSSNWTYSDDGFPENRYVRDNGSFMIESRQGGGDFNLIDEFFTLQNITQDNTQGNGSEYFLWSETRPLELEFRDNWTGEDIFARRYWNITPSLDEYVVGDLFGWYHNLYKNNTVLPTNQSTMVFGLMNKTKQSILNSDNSPNGIQIKVTQLSGGGLGITYLAGTETDTDTISNTSWEHIDGIQLEAEIEVTDINPLTVDIYFQIIDSMDIVSESEMLDVEIDTTIDCFAINNQDDVIAVPMTPTGEQVVYTNMTYMVYWVEPYYEDNILQAQYSKTITITENMTVDAEVSYEHYHDASLGYMNSIASLNNVQDDGGELGILIYNDVTTSSQDWEVGEFIIPEVFEKGTIKCNLTTRHSFSEGSSDFPAKSTQWKNLWVNGTTYVASGEITSNVKTMDYYGDWLEFSMAIEKPYDTTKQYFTAYTRVGNTDTPDINWTSWQEVTNWYTEDNTEDITYFGHINSPNSIYGQYKVEFYNNVTEQTIKIHELGLYLTQIGINNEWGSIQQEITKPYTNYTTLKYDYKLDYLNNTFNGNITIKVDDYIVAIHNFTFFESNWINEEHSLPTAFNSSGTYNLNITVESSFNSTNGTAVIFLDNIELLIEKQAPTITSFNVHNGTSTVDFNGTFTDFTRGSDYDYLGLDGIDSANISIGVFEFDIDTIAYLGNGTFSFETTWINPPFELSERVILNATVTVTDTTDLYDAEIVSVQLPRAIDWIIALMSFGLIMIIIILVFQRHLMTDWDTNPRTRDEGLLPGAITGDK